MKSRAPATRDYFAEMYVAGVMADAGWNIYFPRRDIGFDFMATIGVGEGVLIRPVQVKGKYPTAKAKNKVGYGYNGKLSQMHPEMILAIPYFTVHTLEAPETTAYIPMSLVRINSNRPEVKRCLPANLVDGRPEARRDYAKFFDKAGLELAALPEFPNANPGT